MVPSAQALPYISLTCNYSNITPESDNLAEINFTHLLPSLHVQEQTMGELAIDGIDFHPLRCTVIHTESPAM